LAETAYDLNCGAGQRDESKATLTFHVEATRAPWSKAGRRRAPITPSGIRRAPRRRRHPTAPPTRFTFEPLSERTVFTSEFLMKFLGRALRGWRAKPLQSLFRTSIRIADNSDFASRLAGPLVPSCTPLVGVRQSPR
jgi:hypothetical protein